MNFTWAFEEIKKGKILELSEMYIYKLAENKNDFLVANINNPTHWMPCSFSVQNMNAADWTLYKEKKETLSDKIVWVGNSKEAILIEDVKEKVTEFVDWIFKTKDKNRNIKPINCFWDIQDKAIKIFGDRLYE